jgi:hypothetical protein
MSVRSLKGLWLMNYGNAANWPEVSKERPCPICGKDHRCKSTLDGQCALCFRFQELGFVPDGWRLRKKHPKGGARFVRDDGRPKKPGKSKKKAIPAGGPVLRPASAEPTPAQDAITQPPELSARSAEDRDRVYRAILDGFSLSDAHRKHLRERQFSSDGIDKRGYKTKPADKCKCLLICAAIRNQVGSAIFDAVPGVWQGKSLGMTEQGGILIPVRNVSGQIIALRLRLDDPGDGGKYRWITSRIAGDDTAPSPGTPIHVPLGFVSPSPLVRVTEGELKADYCSQVDAVPTISIPGVGLWDRVFPVLEELQAKTVRVAFDADASTNVNVSSNLVLFIEALRAQGFGFELERWVL